MDLIPLIFTFTLAAFLGFELIAKVPSQLHTPLMSGSNAISGITIVGALLIAGESSGSLAGWIGFAALVLATINRTFLSWLFAIVGAEYVLRWLPRGTHRWRQFLRPGELERGLDANGFVVIDKTGVRVNPLTRRFSLTPIMAVNYMLVAQRIDT